jgi:hypothetical protein
VLTDAVKNGTLARNVAAIVENEEIELKGRRCRRETLASPRWTKPMPKVILGVRFTDGIEVAKEQTQNCRLTSLVTNIRS